MPPSLKGATFNRWAWKPKENSCLPFSQLALSWKLYVLTWRPWLRKVFTGLLKSRPARSDFGYASLPTKAVSARRNPPRASLVSLDDAVQRQLSDIRWSLMVLLTGGTAV